MASGIILTVEAEPSEVACAPAQTALGLAVVHTREGQRPDLSDCPPTTRARGRLTTGIGDRGHD